MKFCIALVACVCAVTMAFAAPERKYEVYDLKAAPALFDKFVKDYNKTYKDDADRKQHYDTFVQTLEDINKLNAESTSATFGINQFADLSEKEMEKHRGLKIKTQ